MDKACDTLAQALLLRENWEAPPDVDKGRSTTPAEDEFGSPGYASGLPAARGGRDTGAALDGAAPTAPKADIDQLLTGVGPQAAPWAPRPRRRSSDEDHKEERPRRRSGDPMDATFGTERTMTDPQQLLGVPRRRRSLSAGDVPNDRAAAAAAAAGAGECDLMHTIEDGPATSVCRNRLKVLEMKYEMHITLNGHLEEQQTALSWDSGGGIFSTMKVDHLRLATCMNAQELVKFIREKVKKCGSDTDKDGRQETLREFMHRLGG
eukprot:gene23199-30289_t